MLFLMLSGCVWGVRDGYYEHPYDHGYYYGGSYYHGYSYRDRDHDRGYHHHIYDRDD
jgi:hypothetical protein